MCINRQKVPAVYGFIVHEKKFNRNQGKLSLLCIFFFWVTKKWWSVSYNFELRLFTVKLSSKDIFHKRMIERWTSQNIQLIFTQLEGTGQFSLDQIPWFRLCILTVRHYINSLWFFLPLLLGIDWNEDRSCTRQNKHDGID